jgi:hypothetical protein
MLSDISLCFYYWYFISSWSQIGILHWKWIPVCMLFHQSQLFTNVETLLCSRTCAHTHNCHWHTSETDVWSQLFADLNITLSECAIPKPRSPTPLPPSKSSRSHIKPQTLCPITPMITISSQIAEAVLWVPQLTNGFYTGGWGHMPYLEANVVQIML